MKRKLFIVVFYVILCISSGILTTPFSAETAYGRVVDGADLLDGSEEADLCGRLDDISERYQFDVVLVTEYSLGGKSPQSFADDFFDYNGYGQGSERSGVLLLHSPEYRDWWISARGYGITVFTDAGIEYIGERITPFLADGDNYGAYSEFADLCDKFLSRAETGSPYDTGSLPAKPLGLTAIAVSLLIGFILAMLIIGIMVSKLKSVRRKADADNYIKAGSMRVTGSSDMFLYRSVSRRERPKNNSGGSSAHRSSSGARHSGGGGKY